MLGHTARVDQPQVSVSDIGPLELSQHTNIVYEIIMLLASLRCLF